MEPVHLGWQPLLESWRPHFVAGLPMMTASGGECMCFNVALIGVYFLLWISMWLVFSFLCTVPSSAAMLLQLELEVGASGTSVSGMFF